MIGDKCQLLTLSLSLFVLSLPFFLTIESVAVGVKTCVFFICRAPLLTKVGTLYTNTVAQVMVSFTSSTSLPLTCVLVVFLGLGQYSNNIRCTKICAWYNAV